jgi:hypothetical protein
VKGMPSSSGQHGVCWCGGWEEWEATTLLRENKAGVPATETGAVEEQIGSIEEYTIVDARCHYLHKIGWWTVWSNL